eukprot:jgi/Mesvir1/6410/Mv19502-RA.1
MFPDAANTSAPPEIAGRTPRCTRNPGVSDGLHLLLSTHPANRTAAGSAALCVRIACTYARAGFARIALHVLARAIDADAWLGARQSAQSRVYVPGRIRSRGEPTETAYDDACGDIRGQLHTSQCPLAHDTADSGPAARASHVTQGPPFAAGNVGEAAPFVAMPFAGSQAFTRVAASLLRHAHGPGPLADASQQSRGGSPRISKGAVAGMLLDWLWEGDRGHASWRGEAADAGDMQGPSRGAWSGTAEGQAVPEGVAGWQRFPAGETPGQPPPQGPRTSLCPPSMLRSLTWVAMRGGDARRALRGLALLTERVGTASREDRVFFTRVVQGVIASGHAEEAMAWLRNHFFSPSTSPPPVPAQSLLGMGSLSGVGPRSRAGPTWDAGGFPGNAPPPPPMPSHRPAQGTQSRGVGWHIDRSHPVWFAAEKVVQEGHAVQQKPQRDAETSYVRQGTLRPSSPPSSAPAADDGPRDPAAVEKGGISRGPGRRGRGVLATDNTMDDAVVVEAECDLSRARDVTTVDRVSGGNGGHYQGDNLTGGHYGHGGARAAAAAGSGLVRELDAAGYNAIICALARAGHVDHGLEVKSWMEEGWDDRGGGEAGWDARGGGERGGVEEGDMGQRGPDSWGWQEGVESKWGGQRRRTGHGGVKHRRKEQVGSAVQRGVEKGGVGQRNGEETGSGAVQGGEETGVEAGRATQGFAEQRGFTRGQSASAMPGVQAYSSLVAALGRAGRLGEARQLFHEMVSRGIGSRDPIPYGAMVAALATNGDMAGARRVIADMLAFCGGPAPTVGVWNALVDGYAARGDVPGAFQVVEEMMAAQGGVEEMAPFAGLGDGDPGGPPHVPGAAAPGSHPGATGASPGVGGGIGRKEGAGVARRVPVLPDRRTYAALVRACRVAGDVETGMGVLEWMRRAGVPRDLQLYNSLVFMLATAGKVGAAFSLVSRMCRHETPALSPDDVTRTGLILACARAQGGPQLARAFSLVGLGWVAADAPRCLQLLQMMMSSSGVGTMPSSSGRGMPVAQEVGETLHAGTPPAGPFRDTIDKGNVFVDPPATLAHPGPGAPWVGQGPPAAPAIPGTLAADAHFARHLREDDATDAIDDLLSNGMPPSMGRGAVGPATGKGGAAGGVAGASDQHDVLDDSITSTPLSAISGGVDPDGHPHVARHAGPDLVVPTALGPLRSIAPGTLSLPPPNRSSFHLALSCLSRAGDAAGTWRMLAVMRHAGHAPDNVAYACAAMACARDRGSLLLASRGGARAAAAESILAHAREALARDGQGAPNAWVYSAVMAAYCGSPRFPNRGFGGGEGDPRGLSSALRLLLDMRRRGVVPHAHTYSPLLLACARDGNLPLALTILREMEQVASSQVMKQADRGSPSSSSSSSSSPSLSASTLPSSMSMLSSSLLSLSPPSTTAGTYPSHEPSIPAPPTANGWPGRPLTAKGRTNTDGLEPRRGLPSAQPRPDKDPGLEPRSPETQALEPWARGPVSPQPEQVASQQAIQREHDSRPGSPPGAAERESCPQPHGVSAGGAQRRRQQQQWEGVAESPSSSHEMAAPTVVSYTLALATCAFDGNLPAALELMDRMRARQVAPDRRSYETLALVCVRAAHAAAHARRASLEYGEGGGGDEEGGGDRGGGGGEERAMRVLREVVVRMRRDGFEPKAPFLKRIIRGGFRVPDAGESPA